MSRVRRLLAVLRLWPAPTRPIGCLTNAEVDALPDPASEHPMLDPHSVP